MPTEKPVQHALTRRPLIGGMPLVGSNSLPSIKRAARIKDKESPSLRQPAQTTDSRSSVDPTDQAPSSVRTTDGDGQTIQSQPSADSNVDSPKRTVTPPVAKSTAKRVPAKKAQPAKKANVRVVDELADDEDDF